MVLGSQIAGEVQTLPEQQAWPGPPQAKALAGARRTAQKTRIGTPNRNLPPFGLAPRCPPAR